MSRRSLGALRIDVHCSEGVDVMSADTWWTVFQPNPLAHLKLVCFPYAGGAASMVRSWPSLLPRDVEVYGIQLPGRLSWIAEPFATHVPELVPQIAMALSKLLDRPFALFGHSLGAILGFEVSRWLIRHRGLVPEHLFVAGRRAPQLPHTAPTTYDKSDGAFIARLRDLNGTPPEVLANEALLRLMLPTLRADFQLVETYTYTDAPPLTCPITAFGGIDDEETAGARLDGWRPQTTKAFTRHVLPGDHFFIHASERELLRIMIDDLARAMLDDRVRRPAASQG